MDQFIYNNNTNSHTFNIFADDSEEDDDDAIDWRMDQLRSDNEDHSIPAQLSSADNNNDPDNKPISSRRPSSLGGQPTINKPCYGFANIYSGKLADFQVSH